MKLIFKLLLSGTIVVNNAIGLAAVSQTLPQANYLVPAPSSQINWQQLSQMPNRKLMALVDDDDPAVYFLAFKEFWTNRLPKMSSAEMEQMFDDFRPSRSYLVLWQRLNSQGIDPLTKIPVSKVVEYVVAFESATRYSGVNTNEGQWYLPFFMDLKKRLPNMPTAQIVQMRKNLPITSQLGGIFSQELDARRNRKLLSSTAKPPTISEAMPPVAPRRQYHTSDSESTGSQISPISQIDQQQTEQNNEQQSGWQVQQQQPGFRIGDSK